MEYADRVSRTKLYVGVGMLGASVLGWSGMVIRLMGSAREGLETGRYVEPSEIMVTMVMGYVVCGLLAIAGLVLTAMGLIDYAAERRARG